MSAGLELADELPDAPRHATQRFELVRALGYASDMRRTLEAFCPRAQQAHFSDSSGLETRGLHPLACEKVLDGLAMYAKHPPDPHRVEPTVMDETTDRFRVDAELVRHFTDADQAWLPSGGRHDPSQGRRSGPSRIAPSQRPA